MAARAAEAEVKNEAGENDGGATGGAAGDFGGAGDGVGSERRNVAVGSGMDSLSRPTENSPSVSVENKGIFASEKSSPKAENSLANNVLPFRKKSLAKKPEKVKSKGRPRSVALPDIGKYYYWQRSSTGHKLEYRPPIRNVQGEKVGQDYEYCGFMNPADWQILKEASNEQEAIGEIRRIITAKRIITFARKGTRVGVERQSRTA